MTEPVDGVEIGEDVEVDVVLGEDDEVLGAVVDDLIVAAGADGAVVDETIDVLDADGQIVLEDEIIDFYDEDGVLVAETEIITSAE